MVNLLELASLLSDKRRSITYLQNVGIIHRVRQCQNNHDMKLCLGDREDRWRCEKSCTNHLENLWNRAKSRNRRQWGTNRGMLDSYLCEFMYRQRNRHNDIYECILRDVVAYNPPF